MISVDPGSADPATAPRVSYLRVLAPPTLHKLHNGNERTSSTAQKRPEGAAFEKPALVASMLDVPNKSQLEQLRVYFGRGQRPGRSTGCQPSPTADTCGFVEVSFHGEFR